MSQMRSLQLFFLLFLSLMICSIPTLAQTPASITGVITATDDSSRPELGVWEYTLNINWDTGSDRGLGQFDLLLDEIARSCSNMQIQSGVVPGDTVGLSYDVPLCQVFYQPEFMFDGEPLIPQVPGQMLKITPFPNQQYFPGPTGSGVFSIFSDFGPVQVEYLGLFLVDADGEFLCDGLVMGVFPGLDCDPVTTEKENWGRIKALYLDR